jgi:hypothetical protein
MSYNLKRWHLMVALLGYLLLMFVIAMDLSSPVAKVSVVVAIHLGAACIGLKYRHRS